MVIYNSSELANFCSCQNMMVINNMCHTSIRQGSYNNNSMFGPGLGFVWLPIWDTTFHLNTNVGLVKPICKDTFFTLLFSDRNKTEQKNCQCCTSQLCISLHSLQPFFNIIEFNNYYIILIWIESLTLCPPEASWRTLTSICIVL